MGSALDKSPTGNIHVGYLTIYNVHSVEMEVFTFALEIPYANYARSKLLATEQAEAMLFSCSQRRILALKCSKIEMPLYLIGPEYLVIIQLLLCTIT